MSENDAKKRVQQQFGKHAEHYVSSQSHARGDSLARLIDLLELGPDARLLDIATGGGHTALAASRHGAMVIAGDITHPMLTAARQHIESQGVGALDFVQHDAENLPFRDASLDAITCRIAPHHFPDVHRFVREAARALKPGGKFGVVDIIAPETKKAANYTNNFEKLRDPSHGVAYSIPDWQYFMFSAGFDVLTTERTVSRQQVGIWAKRIGCDDATIERLRVMLLQAPEEIRAWYEVTAQPGESKYVDIDFNIQQAIFVAQKRA
jgi:ubiquinone/menaquinone biosynthesis C-methylase UbiE